MFERRVSDQQPVYSDVRLIPRKISEETDRVTLVIPNPSVDISPFMKCRSDLLGTLKTSLRLLNY